MSKSSNPTFEALHDYNVDISQRRVFLTSVIADSNSNPEDGEAQGTSDFVVRNLLWLDSHGAGKIELWINTQGGDTIEMWAIHDVMRVMRSPVDTIAYGQVASSGCLLLAAGTGTRWALPNTVFMWHGATEDAERVGAREQRRAAEWSERDEKNWLHHMGRYTTPPIKAKSPAQRARYWERYIRDNALFLGADEMLAHGVIDQVWSEEGD